MTEITKSGRWWEPGLEHQGQPGVLRIQEDGKATLELIGGFDLRIIESLENGHAVSAGSRDVETLFGDCEGEAVTLFRLLELSNRGSFFDGGQPTFQRLHVHRVVIGAHIETEQTPTFRSAAIEIENLTAFLATNVATYDRAGDNNGVALTKTAPESVEVDGWTIRADRATRGFHHTNIRRGVQIEAEARSVIRAIPPQPSSLEDFDTLTLELTDLMTLIAGEACGLIRITLELTESNTTQISAEKTVEIPIWVEVFAQRIHTAKPEEPASKSLLFNCAERPFAETISRWLPLRRKTSNASNVFFGTEYLPGGFMETRLISIGIAAEALHAALFGDAKEVSDEDYQRIKATMLAALDDAAERAWVKNTFHNGHTLRQRLRRLGEVPTPEALSLLTPNIEDWIGWFIPARNGITHTGGGGAAEYKLVRIGQALIRLVYLVELGLSDEQQVAAMRRLTSGWL